MRDAYLMAQTLGFATGTALSVLLLILVWRAERLAGKTRRGSAVVALVLLWNAGSLVRYTALLLGFESVAPLANACAYSALATLPTAALLALPARWGRSWQHYLGLGLRYVSYANAAGLTLGLFAVALRLSFPLSFSTLRLLTAYNFMFHLGVILLLFRGAEQFTHTARAFTRALLLLASGLALGLLSSFHLALGSTAVMVIETLTQQVTIPMAIATFAFLSQFRFADVFIKRSLTILAAVILAIVHATCVIAPLTRAIRASTPRGEAGAWVAATLLWCALLLLFPRCERALNRAADRWLFKRPDYRQLAKTFAREIEPVADESELLAQAAQHIQTALDAAAARVIPRAELPTLDTELELLPGEVTTLSGGHAVLLGLGEAEVKALVPIQVHSQVTHLVAIAPGERGRKLLSDELGFLITLAERIGRKLEALHFERERREQQLREARWQHLLTESQLKALRAQVNPHFLFNTLNTIADLISSEPEKAEAMTERLATVFRYVLARTEGNLIAVSEEFEFLRTYLEIEQARFGDRLRVEMTVDPRIAAMLIPPLILQPLVENAIKHGLASKLTGGTLRICATDEGERLRLTVEDDGEGWRGQRLHSHIQGGVGLKNVTERLQTLYGARASLVVQSAAGEGTQITVTIPKDETQNFDHRRRSIGPLAAAETARRAS